MKSILNKILGGLLVMASLVTLNSCSSDSEGHTRFLLVFVDSVEITYGSEWDTKVYEDQFGVTTFPLYLGGDNLELGYSYTIESDYEINTDSWVWTSSNESAALVDDNGVVYPVGAGESYITVAVYGSDPDRTQFNDQIKVEVSEKLISPTEILITPADNQPAIAYAGGFTLQLTATAVGTASDPIYGSDVTYDSYTWYSSNPAVAPIDEFTGIITTGNLPGTYDELIVTFYAVAADGSGATGSLDIVVMNAIPPVTVTFDDTVSQMYDGRTFAFNENGFSFTYTKEPEVSTNELIEWTISNEDVATMTNDGSNINVTFVGYGSDVTLKARCISSGDSDELTFSVPAGYIRERYESSNSATWDIAVGDGSISSGATQTWKAGETNNYLFSTTYDASGTGSGGRADIGCFALTEIGFNSTYPLVAMRLKDALSYDYVSSRSFQYRLTLQLNGTGDTYSLQTTNKYSYYYDLSDGTQVIVWDFSDENHCGSDDLASVYPTGNNVLIPSVFQLVHSSITLADGYYVGDGTVVYPFEWELHSYETFKTIDDIEAHLTEELGLTINSCEVSL